MRFIYNDCIVFKASIDTNYHDSDAVFRSVKNDTYFPSSLRLKKFNIAASNLNSKAEISNVYNQTFSVLLKKKYILTNENFMNQISKPSRKKGGKNISNFGFRNFQKAIFLSYYLKLVKSL
jgi:hypothetical protein